jgi:DNA-binding LytR/AlgR family response regulator
MSQTTALIAEDEPLLAQALQAELARAWPELVLLGTVGDGLSAVKQALALQPDVLFFDIRMPGLSGLEAATELAEAWPLEGPDCNPFPQLVFVTAHDEYAVQAFEAQALDYVLKPVQAARLEKTVAKLQRALQQARPGNAGFEATLGQLRNLLATQPDQADSKAPPLRVIQARVGNTIHLVPVAEVLYFEATDKYVRLLTAETEYLIRTPLKDLLPRLQSEQFWQIHRSIVVRADQVLKVQRDAVGKLTLTLRNRPEALAVSRLYAPRFRAM